ncbi:MAG: glycosyltransferase [Candidatus Eremiobacteraeota bacterium]|nr:glycosyltransferase [Candidatus Eremiobacteraeota bacterium]
MNLADADFDIVIPTIGRPSLFELLESLARGPGPLPSAVILVDDRRDHSRPLLWRTLPHPLAARVRVLRGAVTGPAAARNLGWRAARAEWIAFLDDDVVVQAHWRARLASELSKLDSDVGGTQGRVKVPLRADRRPTDWERNIKGLEEACWATADMAYRRVALERAGGFDERFPRAFREDADLALRVMAAGYKLVCGRRWVLHPVRPADRWVSIRLQAGNADDALMRALHGPDWYARVNARPGRRARHLIIAAAALCALTAALCGRGQAGRAAAAVWLAGTAEFAWARIAPGPLTPGEIATMLATSAVIPLAATYHWLRGLAAAQRLGRGRTARATAT